MSGAASLGVMKAKLKGAETGHSLLKRKSEALTKRFREITRRIDEAKRKMGRVMQIASLSLAEVTYAAGGNIGYQIQESAKSARFRIRTKQENVSGVLLPTFEVYIAEGSNDFAMTGLGKGGQQVQRQCHVANKKQRDTTALDEELKKKTDQNREAAGSEQPPAEPADLLKSVEDEDVIF
ncbi:vacuolar ATP synthase subunit d-like protein [Thermochaetoides thermophila DSM 1495]|uniref:Vacuolar ATP synthase subunit d-like protein n=1 Tax=Chaetomium thermophilum (strain DSM 1495 / CBS 144.50 / IMI 039719) TaxID=759272 RepID=G0S621_CHATD|nr:vacuolar ATP synthase subunit d-like protein [Thermochaetoides thermophila DSM 1495]EGS21529.1 vacuolar ATP synthase subunit d-like protein [Thermochaetoides thermophila DSM 1495]